MKEVQLYSIKIFYTWRFALSNPGFSSVSIPASLPGLSSHKGPSFTLSVCLFFFKHLVFPSVHQAPQHVPLSPDYWWIKPYRCSQTAGSDTFRFRVAPRLLSAHLGETPKAGSEKTWKKTPENTALESGNVWKKHSVLLRVSHNYYLISSSCQDCHH